MKNKNNQPIIELPQTESRIGAMTEHTGSVEFEKSLSIFGKIKGTITGGELLVIHPQAEVQANIEADYILLAGMVKGSIIARSGICFYAGAVFKGDVSSRVIRMYAGADFDGVCNFIEREKIDIFSLSRGEFRAMLAESSSSLIAQ